MALTSNKLENDVLTIFFQGRLDSTNAGEIGIEVDETVASNPHDAVILDVSNLEYIASAGLRIVLKLGKTEKKFEVIGASTDVYDVFEMTGFSEIIKIKKAYRQMSVEGCEVIGQGAKGTVYRYDPETIIKVYNNSDSLPDIERERELARKAFVLGVPTAISYDIVKVGDKFGSVFELLDSKSLSEYIADDPDNFETYVKRFADLLLQIHDTPVKTSEMSNAKFKFIDRLGKLKDEFTEEEYDKLMKLIEEADDSPNMLHCDYHTNNVMLQNGEVILIDMDTLCYGNPIFELANIHIAYVGFGVVNPKMVENFIGLPYETDKRIWERFLAYYLGTEDKERLQEVEDKVAILSYIRFMRHITRRGTEGDEAKETLAVCKEKVIELLSNVDTLNF